MQCFDPSTHVYYPHHEPYVGSRDDLAGRCIRCREVLDAERAAAAAARLDAQARFDSAYARWMERREDAADRQVLRDGDGKYGRCPDRVFFG